MFTSKDRNPELQYCPLFEKILTQESFEKNFLSTFKAMIKRSADNIVVYEAFFQVTNFNVKSFFEQPFLESILKLFKSNNNDQI